ncbi:RND family efflux transporter MFP subunit [Rhodoblastus acidophilus]|uniref:efflux RND transporter periplasmic adaptor subunit n=1 Tax=Rhodoblastus acidophilus TaxID=1074 RepID=UPI0022253F31|nr:efflux RND transporter periplasmic adaptor subunit [Rhodoblastus acidophilus]MCW2284564.1 RND family efflux transporter MFP subunit [Rhodoblastus acidophilus]MCW2333517.1 RND family efflux transporter MFP subunit [Rhodoblastus acidophilus]
MRAAFRVLCVLLSGAAPTGAAGLKDFGPGASCLIGPNHSYKLAMATAGALAMVAVERSDKVRKGDVIAQLESGVEQAQLEAARVRAAAETQIRLKKAVADSTAAKAERLGRLREQAIANQQSLDDAQTGANAAKADHEQALLERTLATLDVRRLEATLERRILRAPADGVITAVDLHAGEYADPANAVATLTEIDPLRVDVYLPAAAYPLVKRGDRAMITPRDPEAAPRAAEIITRDPQIDASSGLFLVQLRLPNPEGALPAGVRCSVEFVP